MRHFIIKSLMALIFVSTNAAAQDYEYNLPIKEHIFETKNSQNLKKENV